MGRSLLKRRGKTMKLGWYRILLILMLFASSWAFGCASSSPPATAKWKETTVKCAVTGEEIGEKDALKSEYKGQLYYFCCESCKAAFDKDPERFIKR
jgi:YHS domain-containing protein